MTVALDAPIDDKIAAIAETQRARMSRGQLLLAGVGEAAIDRRLARRRLVLIHRTVYGLPHTEEVALAAETAALLACGEGAVLSHHSAITLWALRPGVARPIHVTIPYGRQGPNLAGVVVHRSRTLTPADLRIHNGLPVTSPARALLDASPGLTDRDVERLLGEAIFVRKLTTPAEIGQLLERAGRHPGQARLRRVAAAYTRSTQTDSRPEERMFELIRASGLPEPRLRANLLGYRLDFFWPELRLAVEVDAYGTHGSATRFEADRRRDARLLTEMGIVVVRLTKLGIDERPFEAIAVVARAIGQRETEVRITASGR